MVLDQDPPQIQNLEVGLHHPQDPVVRIIFPNDSFGTSFKIKVAIQNSSMEAVTAETIHNKQCHLILEEVQAQVYKFKDIVTNT